MTTNDVLNDKGADEGQCIVDPKEEARLQALHDYDILDTDPEKEFDDLTRLASEICDAPISRINLIDQTRQWSKSIFGMPDDSIEIPRNLSACQHTIQSSEFLEVPDLKKDFRFKNMPYVIRKPFLRYYLGAPLLTPEGYAIGALCILDYKPRTLSRRKKRQLQILASEVMARFELRKQNSELQKMSRHKTQLMKMLSHDMRSPLNGIIGMSSVLNEELETEEELEMMNIIQQSAIQLNRMIDEVLQYSLIESTGFSLTHKSVDLAEMIDDVRKLYKPSALNKSIELTFTVEELNSDIYLDGDKFEQIIGNLVSNALKFTANGGQVDVRLKEERRGNEVDLILRVKDSGRGIPDEKLESMFENNMQSEGGTQGEKGTGLGLSIIKHFVDLHRGKIDVSSEVGVGTVFTVTVPASKG